MLKVKNSSFDAQRYLDLMNQWMILKHNNITLSTYLTEKGMRKIAIYGMGIYGRHLIREFEKCEDIQLMYGIDMKQMKPYRGINIYNLSQTPNEVDAVINTIIYDTNVAKIIEKRMGCKVISMEDLIFESYVGGQEYKQ